MTGQRMSNTDSFIDEVTEEVRRDRTFALIKRYGWIPALAVVAIVGGAAYNEWSKAQERAQAEALGSEILDAIAYDDATERADALGNVDAAQPRAQALIAQMRAQELVAAGDIEGAVAALNEVAQNGDLPRIYRDIAAYKALMIDEGMDADARRLALEALSGPGSSLRLMALEELAYLDAASGETETAIEGLTRILNDAEVSASQRQRVLDVMTALGHDPESTDQ